MPFSKLSYIKLKIHYQAATDLFMTGNRGSTLAGMFKTALRRVCCDVERTQCRPTKRNKHNPEEDRWCVNVESCLYAFTAEHVSEMGEDTVLPYVISCSNSKQRYIPKGSSIDFDIVLMGSIVEYFHVIISGLVMWEFYDIARFRAFYTPPDIEAFGPPDRWPKHIRPNGNLRLDKIEQILENGAVTIYEHNQIVNSPAVQTLTIAPHNEDDLTFSGLKINFVSPAQFKKKKQIVRSDAVDFDIFYHALARRFTSLTRYFGSAADDPAGEEKMLRYCHEMASRVKRGQSTLEMEKITRGYEAKESYDVLKGEIVFKNVHPCFRSWIKAGEIIHVGKFPTLGFGEFSALFF